MGERKQHLPGFRSLGKGPRSRGGGDHPEENGPSLAWLSLRRRHGVRPGDGEPLHNDRLWGPSRSSAWAPAPVPQPQTEPPLSRPHLPFGRRSREPDTPANSTPTPNCLPFVHQRRNLFLLGSGVRQKDPAPGAPGSPLLSLHAARGDLSDVPGAMEPATRPETGSRCVRAGAGAEMAAGGDQGGQRGPLEGGQRAPGSGSLAASRSGRALVGGLGAGARVTAFQGEGVLAGRPHPTWGADGRAGSGPEGARGRTPSLPAKLAARTSVFHVRFSSIFLPVHFWILLTEH